MMGKLYALYAYFEYVQNKRSGIVAAKNRGKVVKKSVVEAL
jgi:hypothetical protein